MEGFAQQDEWIFDSIERYENLYMYELQYPTQCLEWSQSGTAVCVAGFSDHHGNEILQLALPEKLLPPSKQTVCARRDFKMINGGFLSSPVSSLKYLPHTDVIASCGSQATVSLWMNDTANTALLTMTGELQLKTAELSSPSRCLMDYSTSLPSAVLAGLTHYAHSIQLIDIPTNKTTFQLPHHKEQEPSFLHDLCFAGDATSSFIFCSDPTGVLSLCDPTQPSANHTASSSKPDGACHTEVLSLCDLAQPSTNHTASSSKPDGTCHTEVLSLRDVAGHALPQFAVAVSNEVFPLAKVARLSASGELCLFDVRKLAEPFTKTDVGGCDGGGRFTSASSDHTCVQFSQYDASRVSVSGPCKGVQVFDTSKLTPLFTHEGHEEENTGAHVLVHRWGPLIEGGCKNIVYSADSEGSIHAWQWRECT